MKRRHFLAGAGAAAAGLPIAAHAQVPPYGQQFYTQITIGVNVTLSGPLGKYGNEVVRGVQAAVDEQNRFNVPISHVWGFRTYDDRNDVAQAGANVAIASADASVIGIVGNLTAPMTLAALSRYANANFAVVVPTVTADSITQRGYFNVFRLPTKDTEAGQLFASSALESKKGAAVLAIAFDGDYGAEVAKGFVQQAKTNRHLADTMLFPKDKTDPATAAKSVVDRHPGYVFLCGKTAELGPIAEAMRLAGYTADFGASDGFYNGDTIDKYARVLDGADVYSSLPPLEHIPSMMTLLSDFEHEVGQITAFSAYGYAAAQLIIAASQRASATTRFTLLRSMQQGGTFTTLVGQFRFTLGGDPLIPNIYLYTVGKDGFKFDRPAIRNGFVI